MAENARQAAEARIIEKAYKDDAFRKRLVDDPNGTVAKELGVQIPANLKVKVVEESADTIVLVIPKKADAPPSGKLSHQELEQVAGGWDTSISCGAATQCPASICTCKPFPNC